MIIEYSEDIAPPPVHLDAVFFAEVAENALRRTNLHIEKVKLELGSSMGENYCSQIFRALIQYTKEDAAERETLSVIIKSIPNTAATDFLLDLEVYLKEKITYTEVLPRIEMLLEKCSQRLGPRLYHSLRIPVNTLAFEDLCTGGYRIGNRERGLDWAHSRLVIKRLAQFHAISMVLGQKHPELLKCYDQGILNRKALDRDGSMFMKYFRGNGEALIGLVRQWPGYEAIAEKLQRYFANLHENLCHCQASLPDDVMVLNHGDIWVNNILFRYDGDESNERPQDVIFIDYQMTVWGSLGIDLNYFFYTSLQLETLQQRRDDLIREYHAVLSETLRRLDHAPVPSNEEIVAEVRRHEPYGFFANYGIYPTICMEKTISSDASLENFADDEFARQKLIQIFQSKRLEQMLRYTLKRFDALGIWD